MWLAGVEFALKSDAYFVCPDDDGGGYYGRSGHWILLDFSQVVYQCVKIWFSRSGPDPSTRSTTKLTPLDIST